MKPIIAFLLVALAIIPLVLADDVNVTVCVPDWQCVGGCTDNYTTACVGAADANSCGLSFNGSFSNLSSYCIPVVPPDNTDLIVNTVANEGTLGGDVVADLVVRSSSSSNKIDFTGEGINVTKINFTAVQVAGRRIFIDSVNYTEFDKAARLTFYGIQDGWHIYKDDGSECLPPDCVLVSYNPTTRILIFDVAGFSGYTIGTYQKSDLALIVVDGLGTTFAELVYWLDLYVLAAILLFGSMIAIKIKDNFGG